MMFVAESEAYRKKVKEASLPPRFIICTKFNTRNIPKHGKYLVLTYYHYYFVLGCSSSVGLLVEGVDVLKGGGELTGLAKMK